MAWAYFLMSVVPWCVGFAVASEEPSKELLQYFRLHRTGSFKISRLPAVQLTILLLYARGSWR